MVFKGPFTLAIFAAISEVRFSPSDACQTSRWITEYSEYKFPHLNIHNLSTRSPTSEEENRSKNCKFKRAFEQGWIRVAWWYRHTFLYFTRCAINMITVTGEGSSRLKIIGLLWIYINCDAIDLIPSTQNFITDIAFSYVNVDSSFKPQCASRNSVCQKLHCKLNDGDSNSSDQWRSLHYSIMFTNLFDYV
jgi:hypothetical protein